METFFEYERVKTSIQDLETLKGNFVNKYNEFLDKVCNPMNIAEIWSGKRHDKNFQIVQKLKVSYEESINQINNQIAYLNEAYERYKHGDNTVVKTIEQWNNERLGGAD